MRHYEFMKEDLSVPKLKKEITKKIASIDDFDLLDRIYQVLSQTDVKGKIEKALEFTTQKSNIGNVDNVINEMISSIANVEGTTKEKMLFVEALEVGKVVNTKSLQMATADFSDIFPMPFAERFFLANANFGRGSQMKGPGEFALAIMSPEITLAAKGDIMINKKLIEVKSALSSGSGGRLGETGSVNTTKEAIVAKLKEVASKYMKTPDQKQFFHDAFESVISKSLSVSISALHHLFQGNTKAVQEAVSAVLALSFTGPLPKAVAAAAARDKTGALAEQEYMKQNFEWYKKRDKFNSVMAIWFPGKKVYNFNSGEEFAAMRAAGYLGSPGISFIPSKSNEFFAQINFTKKK